MTRNDCRVSLPESCDQKEKNKDRVSKMMFYGRTIPKSHTIVKTKYTTSFLVYSHIYLVSISICFIVHLHQNLRDLNLDLKKTDQDAKQQPCKQYTEYQLLGNKL